MMFKVAGNTGECGELKEVAIAAKRVMETSQCTGFRVLVRLLRTYFVEGGQDLNIARRRVNCLTKSAYVLSCRSPTSKDRVNHGFFEFVPDGLKIVQRATAMKSFYGASEG